MKYILISTLALFLVCLNQPLSSSTVVDLYVNVAGGSDGNPGTLGRPLKTLAKATTLAMQNYAVGIGTNINIAAGIYRESISLTGSGSENGPPIQYLGSQNGQVVVTGSFVWSGWTQDLVNPQLYSHSWPYRWGECTTPPGWPTLSDIVRRREMIFVNGTLMTQVLSQSAMYGGTFYVDEIHGTVYLWLPSNIDMKSATVEVSTRPNLLYSTLVSNLTLSRIAFQNANPCVSSSPIAGVVISNAAYVTVENSSFDWSNWQGLALFNLKAAVVQSIHADYNGELGVNGWELKNVTMQNVTSSFNNWRGQWGGFDIWETGGSKYLRVHGGTFTGYTAVQNVGRGIWFDTDNANITVDSAILTHNTRNGLYVEKNEGPVTLNASRVCGNQNEGVTTNSALVTLSGNMVFSNQSAQVFVDGEEGSPVVQDWETHVYYTIHPEKMTLSQDTHVGADGSQLLLKMIFLSSTDSNRFLSTLSSSNNTWYNQSQSRVFEWYINGAQTLTDFPGWQAVSKQDLSSKFAVTDPVCLDTP